MTCFCAGLVQMLFGIFLIKIIRAPSNSDIKLLFARITFKHGSYNII